MATRVQSLILGLGKAKQADIATASASFLRFKKLNQDLTASGFTTETDAAEIGKGSEFTSDAGVFPVAFSPGQRIEKYSSAEFLVWGLCYVLGNVVEATGVYTITLIDPGTTLELPYFTIVEQVPEGGGSALDNAFIGCVLNELTLDISSGAGRATGRVSTSWVGSGKLTTPSTITVPAVQAEHNMLSASLALTVDGIDYVTAKTIVSCNLTIRNNIMLDEGLFPGSGLQNGAAIRGRLEIGTREISFAVVARLLATSTEYAKLIAQTTGTAVITLTYDSTHTVTITLQSVSFQEVVNSNQNGLVTVACTLAVKQHATLGVISVTGKCGIVGIAQ